MPFGKTVRAIYVNVALSLSERSCEEPPSSRSRTSGGRMAINFYAPENVSITPADETGVVMGKSIVVDPRGGWHFRTVYSGKPFTVRKPER